MYAPHLPVAQGRSERKKKDEHVRLKGGKKEYEIILQFPYIMLYENKKDAHTIIIVLLV